jgi:hypothetical protein
MASRISHQMAKSRCAREWGGWGRLSDDGPGQHNPDRSEGPWGRAAGSARTEVPYLRIVPDTGQGVHGESRGHEGRRQTRALGKASSDSPALKPYWGKPAVRKRVQERLECSVGDRPTEVKVRSLVAWIAKRRETEFPKPIDKAIFQDGEQVIGP